MQNICPPEWPVVIGSGYNAYGLVRSLGEAGIPSIVISGRTLCPVRYSRYVRKTWIISDKGGPSKNNREQILKKLAQLEKPTLFFPTDERWIVELLDHSAEYQKYRAAHPIRSPHITRLCLTKTDFAHWCQENGVLIPRTLNFHLGESWHSFLGDVSELSFPVVVKPNTKGLGDEELGFHFYSIFEDYEKLASWSKRFEDGGPRTAMLAQEFVPGPVENLISMQGYVDRLENVFVSQYVKLRQTKKALGCANSAWIQDCDAETLNLTQDILLKKLRFRGFFDIEFKRHEQNGMLYLIEINPRPGMLNYAATLMGMNLPRIALHDFSENEPHHLVSQPKLKPGWLWTKLIDDFFLELKDVLTSKPLGSKQILTRMNSWRAPYKHKIVIDPMWSARDLKPGLVWALFWSLECIRRSLEFLRKLLP
jgi:D-aspartate ligase